MESELDTELESIDCAGDTQWRVRSESESVTDMSACPSLLLASVLCVAGYGVMM